MSLQRAHLLQDLLQPAAGTRPGELVSSCACFPTHLCHLLAVLIYSAHLLDQRLLAWLRPKAKPCVSLVRRLQRIRNAVSYFLVEELAHTSKVTANHRAPDCHRLLLHQTQSFGSTPSGQIKIGERIPWALKHEAFHSLGTMTASAC